MKTEGWKDISIREKMQIVNGTVLIWAAIALYFLAFILTMTIGLEVVSAGATLLATGLAFFGITTFVRNQLVNFEASVNHKLKEFEQRDDNKRREHPDNEEGDL